MASSSLANPAVCDRIITALWKSGQVGDRPRAAAQRSIVDSCLM